MNVLDDMMLVYRVAKSYYVDGLGQNDIAKIVGISRPQISRMLNRALEVGIVKIDVSMPEIVNVRDLERELTSCLGIKSSLIVPAVKSEEKDNFFAASARYVSNCLEYCTNIGVGWGRTVYKISRQLEYQEGKNNVVFYPLVGSSGDNKPYLQINGIIDRFAEHYQAKARYLNLLVYQKSSQITSDDKRRLMVLRNKWKHLDGAVVGIGEFNSDNQIYIDEISYDSYLLKYQNEIMGDVLAHMLLQDGSELILPEYTHVACSLEDLLRIPEVIGIARGGKKVDAIYRVAKSGYIKTLITDDITAKEILSKYGYKK